MVDQEEKDIMQTDKEASIGCPNTKASLNDSKKTANSDENQGTSHKISALAGSIVSNNSFICENSAAPVNGYSRTFYHQEYWTLPNYYPDFHKVRQSQFGGFENHFYPVNMDYCIPVDSRIHYVPLKMFSQGFPHEFPLQEFQYFVVIDFEATCDKERKPHPQEIIEFPSVLVNSMTGQLEASFQTYVRPAYHQLLTDFCKELTGIQQIQVDRGVPLSEALLMHDKWLEGKGIKHKNFAVVTWGNWDCRVMLDSECKFKRIRKPPYFDRWINLKVPFQDVFGGVQCNLKEAVHLAGLAWEGRPHCGLDDARNTARLLALLMRWGFRFSITNTLPWPQPPPPPLSLDRSSPQLPPNNNFPIEASNPQAQKPKKNFGLAPTAAQFHPFTDSNRKERCTCFCGVLSSKCVIRKPGPTQGRCFFGCGNWTMSRRAVCNYFAWASSP